MRHAQHQCHVTHVAVIKGCQQGRKDGVVHWVATCITNCTTATLGTKSLVTLDIVGKVSKVSPQQATKVQRRGGRGIALLFFHLSARLGWWSTPLAGRFTPWETRYPLYRRLGGPQGRSGRVRKISPPPGFVCRTIQPIESRYTDCDITGHQVLNFNIIWNVGTVDCHILLGSIPVSYA
jgi:hypothetical protein